MTLKNNWQSGDSFTAGDANSVADAVNAAEVASRKGQANGYASLDSNGKVPDSQLPLGTTSSTVCVGDDSRLSDARTPTAANQVADVSVVAFGASTDHATGTGDFPFGIKLQRNITFTSVTFRSATEDGSGSLIVELRKNGTTVSGSAVTLPAGGQVSGDTATGTWAFSAGDILTVYVTQVDGTPGKGLVADIKGLTA